MSERRTEEIKFRVTPTEKALWQAAAESAGVGLSELIRTAVQEYLWRDKPQAEAPTNPDMWHRQREYKRDVCTTDPCSCDLPETPDEIVDRLDVYGANPDWTFEGRSV